MVIKNPIQYKFFAKLQFKENPKQEWSGKVQLPENCGKVYQDPILLIRIHNNINAICLPRKGYVQQSLVMRF